MIETIGPENRNEVQAFLEERSASSLFLLSNLERYGPEPGPSPYSGRFKCVREDGAIRAVFVLTRRGTLVMQAGSDPRADVILDACDGEQPPLIGVVGPWEAASAVWQTCLERDPDLRAVSESKEDLFQLDLPGRPPHTGTGLDRVRLLRIDDFETLDALHCAYLEEEGLPDPGSRDERRGEFMARTARGHWWGLEDEGRLASIAAYNARYRTTGQVGSVYTKPECRRRGFSRLVMEALVRDSVDRHELERLILFTSERNAAARSLYESLGFEKIGYYALLFGTRGTS